MGDSLTITGCTISDNSGDAGGIWGNNLHVNDCVITDNGGYLRRDSSREFEHH